MPDGPLKESDGLKREIEAMRTRLLSVEAEKRRLAALVESSPVGVMVVDAAGFAACWQAARTRAAMIRIDQTTVDCRFLSLIVLTSFFVYPRGSRMFNLVSFVFRPGVPNALSLRNADAY